MRRKSRQYSGCVFCEAPKAWGSDYCSDCLAFLPALMEVAEMNEDQFLDLDRFETCIYVIGYKNDPKAPVKVGWSTNVLKRLRALQAANPSELEVIAVLRTARGREDEKLLHQYLAKSRVSGEWFRRDERTEKLILALKARSAAAQPDTTDQ